MSKHPQAAVYPGTFDPITLGHLDVIRRASALFEKLIVGVGVNPAKHPMFSEAERIALIKETTADLPNIEVRSFKSLAVNFVQECDAKIMIRGVRPITDIQAELTMMMANRRLSHDVETLFMVADGELAHVSSSLIREIANFADREMLLKFLPECVADAVLEKMTK